MDHLTSRRYTDMVVLPSLHPKGDSAKLLGKIAGIKYCACRVPRMSCTCVVRVTSLGCLLSAACLPALCSRRGAGKRRQLKCHSDRRRLLEDGALIHLTFTLAGRAAVPTTLRRCACVPCLCAVHVCFVNR